MRRPYTIEYFSSLVDHIRGRMPNASVGSDVIVGFPGETDDDFEQLAGYLERSPLTHIHVFPYSDRPGTVASAMTDKVNGVVVRERGRRIRDIGRVLSERFRASQVGTGTATADARPAIATPVQARVTAFNGKTTAGRPAVLLRAVANISGNQVPLVIVAQLGPAGSGFGPSFVVDNGPLTPGQNPAYNIRQLHLNLPDKVVRVRRRFVHFLVAPPTCRGSWLYEQVNTSYGGGRWIATDRVPCVR